MHAHTHTQERGPDKHVLASLQSCLNISINQSIKITQPSPLVYVREPSLFIFIGETCQHIISRVSSCWVFIANSFFSSHQQLLFLITLAVLCKTDCWCDEKKEYIISVFTLYRYNVIFAVILKISACTIAYPENLLRVLHLRLTMMLKSC